MKEPESSARPDDEASKASVVSKALQITVPAIAILHSQALATQSQPKSTGVDIESILPAMDPLTVVATSAAIASIGAYRLMKGRSKKDHESDS